MDFATRVINKVDHLTDGLRFKLLGHYQYNQWTRQRHKPYAPIKDGQPKLENILHINASESVGGAAQIANTMFRYQNEHGLQAEMLVNSKQSSDQRVHVIEKQQTERQSLFAKVQNTLQWQDFFHLSTFDIVNSACFQRADIVHLHNLHPGYFSVLALPLLNAHKPIVWSLHDMHAITGHCAHSFACERWKQGCGQCPDLNSYPRIEKDATAQIWKAKRAVYAATDLHVVTLSKWLDKKVGESILASNRKAHIYNGINLSIFYPRDKQATREALGLPSGQLIVLFSAELGTKNPFKGGHYIEQLHRDYRDRVLFVNIGGEKTDKAQRDYWNIAYIKEPEILAQYYAAADVFLYPTLADNCPLVALEAQACGLPLLTFETGGVPEIVKHDKTGYIAEYDNYDALAAGFEHLLANTDYRKKLSSSAVTWVQENFSSDSMNQEYIDFYHRVLNVAV